MPIQVKKELDYVPGRARVKKEPADKRSLDKFSFPIKKEFPAIYGEDSNSQLSFFGLDSIKRWVKKEAKLEPVSEEEFVRGSDDESSSSSSDSSSDSGVSDSFYDSSDDESS